MKTLHVVMVLLALSHAINAQISINCLPEKGVKIAKTEAKLESESDAKDKKSNSFGEVHYDIDGKVILSKKSSDHPIHKREYAEGKLKFLITIGKDLPKFYPIHYSDSILAKNENEEITDTVFVNQYHANGDVAEVSYPDGSKQLFKFIDCLEESNIFLDNEGDTIQQYQFIYENGVVKKTIWTSFFPVKGDMITEYYDYKFNKRGHWIRRRFRNMSGIVLEKRKLTYY